MKKEKSSKVIWFNDEKNKTFFSGLLYNGTTQNWEKKQIGEK